MDKALDTLDKVALGGGSEVRTMNVSIGHSRIKHRFKDKHLPSMTPLIRVLLGLSEPSKSLPIQELTFFDKTLNPSQREAVVFALQAPEIACIHGPPGMQCLPFCLSLI